MICHQITIILLCGHRLYFDAYFYINFRGKTFLRWIYIWFLQLIMLLFAFSANNFLMWLHRGSSKNILDNYYSISAISKFVRKMCWTKYDEQTQYKRILLKIKKVIVVLLVIYSALLSTLDKVIAMMILARKTFVGYHLIIISVFSFYFAIRGCCGNQRSLVFKRLLFFINFLCAQCILTLLVMILPFNTVISVQKFLAVLVFCFGLIKCFNRYCFRKSQQNSRTTRNLSFLAI